MTYQQIIDSMKMDSSMVLHYATVDNKVGCFHQMLLSQVPASVLLRADPLQGYRAACEKLQHCGIDWYRNDSDARTDIPGLHIEDFHTLLTQGEVYYEIY